MAQLDSGSHMDFAGPSYTLVVTLLLLIFATKDRDKWWRRGVIINVLALIGVLIAWYVYSHVLQGNRFFIQWNLIINTTLTLVPWAGLFWWFRGLQQRELAALKKELDEKKSPIVDVEALRKALNIDDVVQKHGDQVAVLHTSISKINDKIVTAEQAVAVNTTRVEELKDTIATEVRITSYKLDAHWNDVIAKRDEKLNTRFGGYWNGDLSLSADLKFLRDELSQLTAAMNERATKSDVINLQNNIDNLTRRIDGQLAVLERRFQSHAEATVNTFNSRRHQMVRAVSLLQELTGIVLGIKTNSWPSNFPREIAQKFNALLRDIDG